MKSRHHIQLYAQHRLIQIRRALRLGTKAGATDAGGTADYVPYAGTFTGTWDDRMSGLFECGVEYAGKSVLDIGSNLGMIAYEIAKKGPSRITGADVHAASVQISQRIFEAVQVPSAFSVVDLGDSQALRDTVTGKFDIVLYLAVDQHVRRQIGAKADDVARHLFDSCTEALLFRAPEKSTDRVRAIAAECGFAQTWEQADSDPIRPLMVFRRTAPAG